MTVAAFELCQGWAHFSGVHRCPITDEPQVHLKCRASGVLIITGAYGSHRILSEALKPYRQKQLSTIASQPYSLATHHHGCPPTTIIWCLHRRECIFSSSRTGALACQRCRRAHLRRYMTRSEHVVGGCFWLRTEVGWGREHRLRSAIVAHEQ